MFIRQLIFSGENSHHRKPKRKAKAIYDEKPAKKMKTDVILPEFSAADEMQVTSQQQKVNNISKVNETTGFIYFNLVCY